MSQQPQPSPFHQQPVPQFAAPAPAIADPVPAPPVRLFVFVALDGREYALPPVTHARSLMTGQDLRDAVLGGETGQLAYALKALEAAAPPPEVLAALYALPQDQMMSIIGAWAEHGDGDGATLGESPSS